MTTYSILLVEDNAGDADYIQRALRRSEDGVRFEVSVVGWLNTALTTVGARSFDAVLLDLSLPDSQGLDTVVQFLAASPQLPVIVMTGHDDMITGVNAVRYGAQDYLIKGDTGDRSLERSIIYAIERKRADMVGKKLLRASIGTLSSAGGGATALIHEHLAHVADFLHDLRAYIARNAPAHADSIEAIASNHQIDVVLREIRAIVQMDVQSTRPGTVRPKKISEEALQAVSSLSSASGRPVAPSSARGALLSVIESSGEIGERYAVPGVKNGSDDE